MFRYIIWLVFSISGKVSCGERAVGLLRRGGKVILLNLAYVVLQSISINNHLIVQSMFIPFTCMSLKRRDERYQLQLPPLPEKHILIMHV